jgi:hypothetical protein
MRAATTSRRAGLVTEPLIRPSPPVTAGSGETVAQRMAKIRAARPGQRHVRAAGREGPAHRFALTGEAGPAGLSSFTGGAGSTLRSGFKAPFQVVHSDE